MAKRYTSTLQLRCWKQHTCASCGTAYAYILQRKVVGNGTKPEKASADLQKRVVAVQRDENDMQPCPTCGQYQQDMIGLRLGRRRNMLWLAALVMPIVLPVLRGSYAVQANTLTWVAAVYCAAALVVHYLVGSANPNRDREANRQVAAQRVSEGVIHVQPVATTQTLLTPESLPRASQSIAYTVALAVLFGSILLAVVPELARSFNAWPLNTECYPPVVGPSDTTRIYMADSITSIKGFWRGTPQASLRTDDSLVPMKIDSHANQNDWGSTIYAKSDEKTNHSHPWVEVTLPSNAALAGKTVTCHIALEVEFPEFVGNGTFNVTRRHTERDVSIQLAPPGAGGQYNGTWWTCTTVALVLVLADSIVLAILARRYRRQAKPTQVFPVQEA